VGQRASQLTADWFNDVQENLCQLIEAAGIELVKGDYTQLYDALVALSASAVPAGTMASFAASSPPAGWLKCNGAAISRASYSALFAKIGTTWGAGNGTTTFNVPDLRGEFLRGWDNGRGVDSGRAFASSQDDRLKDHYHGFGRFNSVSGGDFADDALLTRRDWSGAGETLTAQQTTGDSQYLSTLSLSGGNAGDLGTSRQIELVSGAGETRPRNVAVLTMIKF
jgi:microcystin-dependent protein